MNIYQKLIEVRKTVQYLKKENKGNQYSYVSSSQTLASVKTKMDELGLVLIPKVIGKEVHESTVEWEEKQRPKRQTTYFTELIMEYTWVNADAPEETIVCPWYGQGVDIAGEKGVGKAMTYAEKYFMLKFFNIPTDKDDPDHFQKKIGSADKQQNEDKKAASQTAYDVLLDWIDKVSQKPECKDPEVFKNWWINDENKKLIEKKQELSPEDLQRINRQFEQMHQFITDQSKKAA